MKKLFALLTLTFMLGVLTVEASPPVGENGDLIVCLEDNGQAVDVFVDVDHQDVAILIQAFEMPNALKGVTRQNYRVLSDLLESEVIDVPIVGTSYSRHWPPTH